LGAVNGSLLSDAFGHHMWATLTLLDTCAKLNDEQLATSVPGTYGPILGTARHLAQADRLYLFVLNGGRTPLIDASAMSLPEVRDIMESHGPAWAALLEQDLEPAKVIVRRRADGSETHAPIGVRLAQALHHGTDHRSQICTALTVLGLEPPDIDVWAYAAATERLIEIPRKS